MFYPCRALLPPRPLEGAAKVGVMEVVRSVAAAAGLTLFRRRFCSCEGFSRVFLAAAAASCLIHGLITPLECVPPPALFISALFSSFKPVVDDKMFNPEQPLTTASSNTSFSPHLLLFLLPSPSLPPSHPTTSLSFSSSLSPSSTPPLLLLLLSDLTSSHLKCLCNSKWGRREDKSEFFSEKTSASPPFLHSLLSPLALNLFQT